MNLEEFNKKKETCASLLVDFYAEWCEPCKILDGILDEVAQNLTEKITILKIDLDESDELKNEYAIMSVPTLMIFNKGVLAWRMPGFMMAADLTRKMQEYI